MDGDRLFAGPTKRLLFAQCVTSPLGPQTKAAVMLRPDGQTWARRPLPSLLNSTMYVPKWANRGPWLSNGPILNTLMAACGPVRGPHEGAAKVQKATTPDSSGTAPAHVPANGRPRRPGGGASIGVFLALRLRRPPGRSGKRRSEGLFCTRRHGARMHFQGLPAAAVGLATGTCIHTPGAQPALGSLGQSHRLSRCSLLGQGTNASAEASAPNQRPTPPTPLRAWAVCPGGHPPRSPRGAAVPLSANHCYEWARRPPLQSGGKRRSHTRASNAQTARLAGREWGAGKPGEAWTLLGSRHVRLCSRPAPEEPNVHVHSTRRWVNGTCLLDGQADGFSRPPGFGAGEEGWRGGLVGGRAVGRAADGGSGVRHLPATPPRRRCRHRRPCSPLHRAHARGTLAAPCRT